MGCSIQRECQQLTVLSSNALCACSANVIRHRPRTQSSRKPMQDRCRSVCVSSQHACRDKESGIAKGDGTVTFLLRPSVRIATTIMHGRPLRPGGAPEMTVQEAEYQMKGDFVAKKKNNSKAKKDGAAAGGKGAKGKGGAKGGKPVQSQKDRLLSWGGFDDVHKASEARSVCFVELCRSAATQYGYLQMRTDLSLPNRAAFGLWHSL